MAKSLRSSAHQCLLDVLVEARKKSGLTQAALADRIGRPQSFVAKYENGERRIDAVEFVELTRAMDKDPRKLFNRFLALSAKSG